MKAQDLRIGNYLEKSLKSGQGRKLIDKIGCQDIVRIFENTGSFNYQPIPITEDILLKCGFSIHKNADSGDFKGYSFGFNPFSEDYILLVQKATIGYYYDNAFFKINYLHQLQNLYFALTGEELKLK